MDFTWEPLESHRAHVVNVPLAWHGDRCHIMCNNQGKQKEYSSGEGDKKSVEKQGERRRPAVADCDWRTEQR